MKEGIEYYEPICSGVKVENFHDLLLLIGMRLRRQSTPPGISLTVVYPENNEKNAYVRDTAFRVYGFFIDDSETSPFPKLTLWLDGKCRGNPLFGLLTMDLLHPTYGKQITLSPVPFGMDCKPKLPFEGKELETFLSVARIILLGGPLWTQSLLASKSSFSIFGDVTAAAFFLNQSERLGLTQFIHGAGYKVLMLPQWFEEVFGKKLS